MHWSYVYFALSHRSNPCGAELLADILCNFFGKYPGTHLSCSVADDLTMQGARASIDVALTYITQKVPVSAPEELEAFDFQYVLPYIFMCSAEPSLV